VQLIETLRWFVPAVVPAALAGVFVYRSDLRREPLPLALTTFGFGGVAAACTLYVIGKASQWSGLDVRSSVSGEGAALLFLFCLVAPLGEFSKVAATWPAFLSDHFDEPYDGIVYAGLASLGFSAVQSALILHAHPTGGIWVARALLSMPAHLFFACTWGYALGRAKQGRRRPTSIFPVAWVVATAGHGLYAHIVYGRGPGALVGVVPLLLAMGGAAWVAGRDLRRRGDRPSREWSARVGGDRLSGVSFLALAEPPSLHAVREALRRSDRPIMVRWIFFGALVTVGAMVAGITASVLAGHWMHVDFSVVDEHDAATTAPLVLLGLGLLAGFPVSGFLVARASNVTTLLEPALGSALAIASLCAMLGLMAPVALVFAFAFSPIAFGLSCAGAWAGIPTA
jgi:RsiW-degrading membrane proteinase PrsW (M82 family)